MNYIAEEIYFWSGIMRDHADFLLSAFSYKEKDFIKVAEEYKKAFSDLRREANEFLQTHIVDIQMLRARTIQLLSGFINYKRLIVRKLLECNIGLGFPPSFVNHMINEAMEFYRTLNWLCSEAYISPTKLNIHLHRIWLRDASGHAASIAAELDPTETELIKEAREFKKRFDSLYIKTEELDQMLERACLDDGSLKRLNEEVREEMDDFIFYLDKVRILRRQCKAMGTLNPLILDHMIREEKYYLSKLDKVR